MKGNYLTIAILFVMLGVGAPVAHYAGYISEKVTFLCMALSFIGLTASVAGQVVAHRINRRGQ
jgi:hypothetical protein